MAEVVVGGIVVVITFIAMYKVGYSDGTHKERMRMIDVLDEVNNKKSVGLSDLERRGVRFTVAAIIAKLREGR